MLRSYCLPLLASLAACAPGGPANHANSADHTLLGRRVTFMVPDNSGTPRQIPEAGARATVLDFWSPTCAPCKDTVPVFAGRVPELAREGILVHFVAVLARNSPISEAERTLDEWGAPDLPFLVDRDGAIQLQLELEQLPASIVADSSGTVRWVAPRGASPLNVESAAKSVADAN